MTNLFRMFILLLFLMPAVCLATCPGDTDCDGDVDGQDLSSLVADFGSQSCGACPTIVDMDDYRSPAGTSIQYERKFYGQDNSVSTDTLTINYLEGYKSWIFESGAHTDYYRDKYEKYDSEGSLTRTCTYDGPAPKGIPNGQKKVGETWGGGYLSSCDSTASNTIMFKVFSLLAVEDVTVPAGTFTNCIKTYRDRGKSMGSIQWYAPGIGMIKRIYESDSGGTIYEMTSYSLPPQ